jgi:hypothetical protein
MEVISVPPTPKAAFHKGRPMSDLIKAQIRHFKHVEEKLSHQQRERIPQHRITTENEAAVYIAAMTRLLRSGVGVAKPKIVPITAKKSSPRKPAKGLAIAASAAKSTKPHRKTKTKSSSKKK